MCASSWVSTIRRRSEDHSMAPAGRMMRGQKTPHVTGMAAGLLHCRTDTRRAISSDLEISARLPAQSSAVTVTECADTHAVRARPPSSRSTMRKAPTVQLSTSQPRNWLNSGDAEAASTTMEGSLCEFGWAATGCARLKNPAASPSTAECHAGSRNVSTGKASEARVPTAHT